MLSKLKKPNNEGFTIIEVLIVLAIAGLILLIVFLAVPALQRSSRNTSRKNDAAAVLAAFSEYTNNNGGSLPTDLNFAAPTLTVCNIAGCTGGTDAESTAKLGFYTGTATSPTKGDVTINTTCAGANCGAPAAADELLVYEGATCASATAAQAGSSRAIAALYGLEASGGYVWQCTGS